MSKQKTLKWYREQILYGLERTRSKALHDLLFNMMVVYYSNPQRYEKSLRSLMTLNGKEGKS